METSAISPVMRFGNFELDLNNSELRRQGVMINLQPQAMRVLILLVSRANRLVTRGEIIKELWPNELVGDLDNRLNFEIKKIREALRDDAERPRYIKTVRKRGYKFISAVEKVENDGSLPEMLSGNEARLAGNSSQPQFLAVAEADFGGGQEARFSARTFLLGAVAGALALAAGLLIWHLAARAFATRPTITAVTPIVAKQTQQITIEGHGFGYYYTPLNGLDTPYLAIGDDTGHWSAGRTVPENADDVTLRVRTWTDTEIVIDGFAGEYGQKGWVLKPGDKVKARVWNPLTGAGPAEYYLRVGVPKEETAARTRDP